ncbi:CmlA/FloR family chloramphenicol efflux MFS transporter [Kistimonas scapharcae]|uniref:Bcr/CflA family efflux transporter n=1 Tax=Kistimonas scapharcae TaxID=1036133 RepID=A0ABP8V3C3_9GAMM
MSLNNTWNLSLSRTLLLMVPFDLLASLGMDVYLPAVPEMASVFSTSPGAVQLTLSLYMLMLGCGQLVFGPLSDRLGRRPVLLGGNLLFVVSSIALVYVSTIEGFVFWRVCQGAGGAASLVATFATVRDVYGHRREAATIYALLGGMLAFVPALGPVIGALLIGWAGWQSVFWALALAATLAGFHAVKSWPETRSDVTGIGVKTAFLQVVQSGGFWLYTLAFSVAMGAFFVYFSSAPRMLIGKLGYSPIVFSLLFSTVALVMIVMSRFAGRIVSRFGTSGTLRLGMVAIGSGALLMLVAQMLSFSGAASLLIPMFVVAVGISCTCAVSANGALAAFQDIAGTAVALYYCIEALLVCIVGTLVVTLLPGDTLWPLIVFCGGGAVVVLAGMFFVRR